MSDLNDAEFWIDVRERVIRNVAQTAAPVLAAVSTTGKGIDYVAFAVSMGTVAVLTVVKSMVGLKSADSDPTWVRWADRIGSAVAVTFLGFVPEAALSTWQGWASVDWSAVGLASLGSALLALTMFYFTPPSKGDPA